jgi:trimethylamine---corrinoid protein Co-methyltransferase
MAAILAAVCGSHAIHMHGGVHAELTWHPVQAILDDDIAGMVGRFLQGLETTPDALALDVMTRVGPIPGHYLEEESTLMGWRALDYVPRVSDRTTIAEWAENGKKSAADLATSRLEYILAHHSHSPLSADQDRAVEEILQEARRHYAQKGIL